MRISDWSSDVCSSDLQFSLGSIDIGGVTIDDGAIVYDDAQAGKHYELQKLHLETGSLNARDPFDLDLSTTVISKAPAAQVDVALSGTIKPDFEAQKLDTDGLKLSVKRSEEHTSELQSLMRISYAVFCWKKKKTQSQE